MADPDRRQVRDSRISRVSEAMVEREGGQTFRRRLREAGLWLLIDVSRWRLIAGLAVAIFAATMLVGTVGPASTQQYLFEGTPIANAYIELQPGMITALTVVLAINQLVLSPELGSISHQRQRVDDVLSYRRDIEENADVTSSPSDPSEFLGTVIDAARDHLRELEEASRDGDDQEFHRRLTEYVADTRDVLDPVSDALDTLQFGQIELLGVAIHYDADRDIRRLRGLRREYERELTETQSRALDELLTALKQYDVAREYFRTRYLQTQFISFSRAVMFTALPAIAVAHYAVGIIGSGVLSGTTAGVRTLLWFESGTFTVTMLPVLVIVSYVARIISLAETSVFVGPFSADESTE